MIPHHVYYQLAVVGLLWLCVMLHYVWPRPSVVPPRPSAEPAPPQGKRHRFNEPTPFKGLTQRPPCATRRLGAQHGVMARGHGSLADATGAGAAPRGRKGALEFFTAPTGTSRLPR